MNLIHFVQHRKFIVEHTKEYFKPLYTLYKFFGILNNGKLLEAIKLLNSLEQVETNNDGDLYLGFKNNVIVNVNGSTVILNKNEFIVSYKYGSFSPDFNIDKLVNIKDINGSVISIIAKRKELTNINIVAYYKTLEEALGDTKTNKEKT